MAIEKSKTKKKPMTLEDLATAIHRDLARMATKEDLARMATKEEVAAIRAEMATKDDLSKLREDMLFKFGTLEVRIGNAKDELQEQISGLKYAKEIDELRARVVTLEEKVGVKPSRRAA